MAFKTLACWKFLLVLETQGIIDEDLDLIDFFNAPSCQLERSHGHIYCSSIQQNVSMIRIVEENWDVETVLSVPLSFVNQRLLWDGQGAM